MGKSLWRVGGELKIRNGDATFSGHEYFFNKDSVVSDHIQFSPRILEGYHSLRLYAEFSPRLGALSPLRRSLCISVVVI